MKKREKTIDVKGKTNGIEKIR